MNQQIQDISKKLQGVINGFCVYESGLRGLLINQMHENFGQNFRVFGIADDQLLFYRQLFNEQELLYVEAEKIQLPAFVLKTIAARLFQKTQNDFIIAVMVYQQKTYVCIAITGNYFYEAEFSLNDVSVTDQIYEAYVRLIDIVTEVTNNL
ncbi:hypothetical protein J2Z62_000384 [Mycoplasmoides fastidiosum]|uniref:Uncharacterized protein n=1 Tax=Mycoplasmoides fastidiosum TaxID=92758 RepID=A0ABU0LZ12_9BACT|nr:hypothetical protein [Mycoplasmoides fastidiosum]MDQ0513946.1 hypothetical protein [Mycoplasmoides fastidiosum]UUD37640.1 hypothetical protein NPA10_03675 [Mycoplasmoides fastidiosum]